MPKKQTRRMFLKRIFSSLLTLLGLGSGGYIYANRIEPFLLEIVHMDMKHPLIPQSFAGKKIVQFSDTHLGFHYSLQQFKKLAKTINNLGPDIIFFTGDLMDEPNKYSEINQLVPILQSLHAPLGKFCIYGNHDHGGYGSEIYRNVMETAGFQLLLNHSTSISLNNFSRINIIGIDDRMLGKPDIPLALKTVTPDQFNILLSHAPDVASDVSQYPVHWQLSGHSHGGQVKIPFIGPLVIPPFAKVYYEGFYRVGDDESLSLYVNRGIGTTRLPFRFLSKPEITVFTLKPEGN
ncbi:metallophosphoesterase [Neobacillus sedimentimangrovi]|jgi:uncharacterized protein|uniref:Metallophosphoesterase n=1 Tax=Neobacillus sedimentimangrovi TaxID=2699460 RepID=A0ABS8QNB2_9BACI|nr:metallophosphoesterase [Neobacillus sedimentimangrovi]MCD4840160.1 metallophosphoesterase [Neobacillus sedimentimangrovi]